MSLLTGIAIFIIIWWLLLFIILPFRLKSQIESSEAIVRGSDPAAPVGLNLARRLFFNTLAAVVVFFVFWFCLIYLELGNFVL